MTGESPETVKRACCPRDSRKTKSSPLRNEAQLNCVSLRSEFDYEVTWGAVKGQDERPCETPLTAPHVTPGVLCIAEKIIRMAATSALDFFDLLIEARGIQAKSRQHIVRIPQITTEFNRSSGT